MDVLALLGFKALYQNLRQEPDRSAMIKRFWRNLRPQAQIDCYGMALCSADALTVIRQ